MSVFRDRLADGIGGEVDAVVVFAPGAVLATAQPLPWGAYTGRRWLLEHDAVNLYQKFFFARSTPVDYRANFRRHGFDSFVVSSPWVAQRLLEEGFPALWLPKAADTQQFRDLGHVRHGLGTYGTRYPPRAMVVRNLRRAGIEVLESCDRVPYEKLPSVLNAWEACLVCNMAMEPVLGPIGRVLYRWREGSGLRLQPGHEPMIKNFEAASAGCAVFMDRVDGLEELGFVDGKTAFIYERPADLVDRLRSVDADTLREVGRAGAELCQQRHSWEHRAAELLDRVTA